MSKQQILFPESARQRIRLHSIQQFTVSDMRPNFALVPLGLLEVRVDGKSLAPECFKLYVGLESFVSHKTNECYPRMIVLQKRTDLSAYQARKAIYALIKSGYLGVKKNRTSYIFVLHWRRQEPLSKSVTYPKSNRETGDIAYVTDFPNIRKSVTYPNGQKQPDVSNKSTEKENQKYPIHTFLSIRSEPKRETSLTLCRNCGKDFGQHLPEELSTCLRKNNAIASGPGLKRETFSPHGKGGTHVDSR